MLFLKPPYINIDGVTIFSDHANELQKYYLPAAPHITTLHDDASGDEIPQITLLKYRGDAGSGGFLNFDVNLGIDADKLNKVRGKLKQLLGLQDDPILGPVPLVDGNVRLLMLGKSTEIDDDGGVNDGDDDSDDGDNANRPEFVLKIDHHAKPSLYGDNQAIFSVELDEEGVQLMEQSMEGAVLPVGVVYSLEFHALRPAYNVNISADWSRIQHHFEESFSVESVFFDIDIQEIVDELVEEQMVTITVDTFVPEGEDDSGIGARRDRALNDFKDMLLQTFFVPSLEPIQTDNRSDFVKSVDQLSSVAATSGSTLTFGYKQVDITRIDEKHLNFNMSERTTVSRQIYPQAHLAGLSEVLRDSQGNLTMDRFVRSVTLDDGWFEKRALQVRGLVNYVEDQVDSINLTLNYDGRPKNVMLLDGGDSAATGQTSWNSKMVNGIMARDVEYSYVLDFKGVNTAERPGRLVSKPAMTQGDALNINPRGEELYFIDKIQLGAHEHFPWETYPVIEIHLEYDDEANAIHLKDNYLLRKDTAEVTWHRFRLNKQASTYRMKVIYRAQDHRDIERDWIELDQERFTFANPRPGQRNVQVIPAVDWAQVSFVFVELSYTDAQNAIHENKTVTFSKDEASPQTFSIALKNPELIGVEYSAKILFTDNTIKTIPRSSTQSNLIVVRADMVGHRMISLNLAPADFLQLGVKWVEVSMRYEDVDAGLEFADDFIFRSSDGEFMFEFDYVDVQRDAYSCRARVLFDNGMSKAIDLGLVSDSRLVIDITQ